MWEISSRGVRAVMTFVPLARLEGKFVRRYFRWPSFPAAVRAPLAHVGPGRRETERLTTSAPRRNVRTLVRSLFSFHWGETGGTPTSTI